MFKPIETSRLLLREVIPADAEAMFSWASDPGIMTYMGWPRHRSIEDSHSAIRMFVGQAAKGVNCCVVIIRKSDGLALGSTGWGFDSPGLGITGWIMRREAHRQGYASEGVAAMLEAAFRDYPELKVMEATIHPDNLASLKLAEKIGMKNTGGLKRRHVSPNLDGKEHDLLVYRIERPF